MILTRVKLATTNDYTSEYIRCMMCGSPTLVDIDVEAVQCSYCPSKEIASFRLWFISSFKPNERFK